MEGKILSPEVVAVELQRYLLARVAKLPVGETRESWTRNASLLREKYLREVVFHGWPDAWVKAPLRVEDLGLMPSGPGYSLRKLRFEIVPGFQGVALLYEPAGLKGRVPAVLNVHGHESMGMAVEYKQKRCINQAMRGMLALNIEWLGTGELGSPENGHRTFGAHLDLVGANAVGLFHLAMRKGLDYLYDHPNTDRSRIAVTGLSGGGWQTIVLAGLDERVTVAIPVAGYAALKAQLETLNRGADIEQTATDMQTVLDYAHLTAMRAPKPTLLIYNAEDDCCNRGALVKPATYDEVVPFFGLYSAERNFAWHLNTDPGYHNYQRENREVSYRFLMDHFGLSGSEKEIPVDAEVRSPGELLVGLPADNLTIFKLARKLAAQIERKPIPAGSEANREWATHQRAELGTLVRYRPAGVETAFAVHNTHNIGIETISYRFQFTNGLSASGVLMKLTSTPAGAPATILLHDKGRNVLRTEIASRLYRGEQVLAADLVFVGEAEPRSPKTPGFARWIYTVGDRPLGLQSAQLHGLAAWLQKAHAARSVRVEADGMRSQTATLVSAALNPDAFGEVVIRNGIASFGKLFDARVTHDDAPELFCLDLYRKFDLDRIARLSAPTRVVQE